MRRTCNLWFRTLLSLVIVLCGGQSLMAYTPIDESSISVVIHVTTDGDDANDGLSASDAVATPAYGVDLAKPYLQAYGGTSLNSPWGLSPDHTH